MTLHDLIPILQSAIGPVILVSGVGLLLLSMTNRFGRVIDRARLLTRELRTLAPNQRSSVSAQLAILMRRARIIRSAIAFAAVSVLLAAILVIVLFISAAEKATSGLPVAGLFVACLCSLIVSLALFIADINLSLSALQHEVGDAGG